MKLRIKGNSIRLRLTKNEIAEISQGHPVSEAIEFSKTSSLIYRLEASASVNLITASFEGHTVSVKVPPPLLEKWATSNEVSIKNRESDPEVDTLFILIEKDFFCLKPRTHESEDESDLFQNPNEAHGSCG